MNRWVKGCLGLAVVSILVLGIAAALLGPRVVKEGKRFYEPVMDLVRTGNEFEEFVENSPWKEPEPESLSEEQLDRFLSVRERLDRLYVEMAPRVRQLPRNDAQSLDEAAKAMQTIGDPVPRQLEPYLELQMTPREYHYIDEIVYGRWRVGLRREGVHPEVRSAAAQEIRSAAEGEEDADLVAGLRRIAGQMEVTESPPPDGFDPEIHALLLTRLDDIERYSLEAFSDLPIPTVP